MSPPLATFAHFPCTRSHAALVAILAIAGLAPRAAPRTWFVDPDGRGDAVTIATALFLAAPGDTIELACGTYLEHDLELVSGVTIASETRDPGCATIDARHAGRVFVACTIDEAGLLGVTIANGLAMDDGGPQCGPGSTGSGGGLYAYRSSLRITSCRFLGNATTTAFGKGGGARFDGGEAELTHCTFERNASTYGAAVYAALGRPALLDCDVAGNAAAFGGGGLYAYQCSPLLSRCRFVENEAPVGGALVFAWHADGLAFDCLFARCAADSGGAVAARVVSRPRLVGCTLAENDAPQGSACASDAASTVTLERSIVAFGRGGDPAVSGGTPPEVACSDVYGNAAGDWVGALAGLDAAAGNFSADPLFCDVVTYALHAGSPCLPGNHPEGADCDRIGAEGYGGCDVVTVPAQEGTGRARVIVAGSPARIGDVVRFGIEGSAEAILTIFDPAGRLLSTLAIRAGVPFVWAPRTARGRALPAGVYFVRATGPAHGAGARFTIVP